MLVSFGRTAHIHGLHQLVTYLHQRLSPGSQLASPQLSSIHRLTWLGATSSSGLVGGGVKLSAVALVALAHVLGRGGWQCLPSATERLYRATHLATALPTCTMDRKVDPHLCFGIWAFPSRRGLVVACVGTVWAVWYISDRIFSAS